MFSATYVATSQKFHGGVMLLYDAVVASIVPVLKPVYMSVTGICTGTAPIASTIGAVIAANGTNLAPRRPAKVETSRVAANKLPATVPTAKTFTSEYSSAKCSSKFAQMRRVDSSAVFDLPGKIASIDFGNSAGVELDTPKTMSATPSTARLYC